MNLPSNRQNGFTIIELMLAMGFISLLMLAIAMLTIHISTIYNQGITLREVNQAGIAVSEDLQRTISSASPFIVDEADESSRYINKPGGGRLCVGNHTYVWNYLGEIEGTPPTPLNKYTAGNSTPISFAKVIDPDHSLCRDLTENINQADASELLFSGDRNLVLYEFSVKSPDLTVSSSQALYSVDFTLGTSGTDIVDAANKICKPPSESDQSREYCAVNKFSIIVRAGSEAGGR